MWISAWIFHLATTCSRNACRCRSDWPYREGQAVGIAREGLKRLVAEHEVRLMVATDAACEGLNLQTLGTGSAYRTRKENPPRGRVGDRCLETGSAVNVSMVGVALRGCRDSRVHGQRLALPQRLRRCLRTGRYAVDASHPKSGQATFSPSVANRRHTCRSPLHAERPLKDAMRSLAVAAPRQGIRKADNLQR